jgi:hypothetical protein
MTSDDILNMVEEPKAKPEKKKSNLSECTFNCTATEGKLLEAVLRIARMKFGNAAPEDLKKAQALMVLTGKC